MIPDMLPHPDLAEIVRKFVIGPGVAPAAVVATGFPSPNGFAFAEGAAFKAQRLDLDARVFFDLASITKSLVAVTLARLVQRGRLEFDTPLHDLLPEARGTVTGSASVLLLLAHRAGLEAHRTLFAPLLGGLPVDRRASVREVLNGRRPECAAAAPASGHPPVYSDLGFALVGLALQHLEQLPLDEIVDREVCGPLGLEVGSARQLRARHCDFAARCMPTETVPFRGGEVSGVVHDENAWALSGHGLSGHAGLFGTAESVARFGAALLDARAGRPLGSSRSASHPCSKNARGERCGPGSTENRPTSPLLGAWRVCAVSATWGSLELAFGAIQTPTGCWSCSRTGSVPPETTLKFEPPGPR